MDIVDAFQMHVNTYTNWVSTQVFLNPSRYLLSTACVFSLRSEGERAKTVPCLLVLVQFTTVCLQGLRLISQSY